MLGNALGFVIGTVLQPLPQRTRVFPSDPSLKILFIIPLFLDAYNQKINK